MLMILLMFVLWGLDAFVFIPRWAEFAGKGMKRAAGVFFVMAVLSFLCAMAAVFGLSFRNFSILIFLLMSGHLAVRLRFEDGVCRRVYYEDRLLIKEGAFFLFVGTLLAWFWGVMALSAVIRGVTAFIPDMGPEDLVPLSLLSFTAALWMVLLIGRFQKKNVVFSLQDLTGLGPAKGSFWLIWILPVLLGVVIAGISGFSLVHYFDQVVTPFSELMDWAEPSWMITVFLIVAVIAAPFLEEVIFRGFFFRILHDCRGWAWAFWVVGVSFGLLHMDQYWGNWAAIGIIFFLGFLMTWLRAATASARPSIVLHYIFNMMMVITPAIFFMISRPVFFEYYMNRDTLSFHQKEDLLQRSRIEHSGNALVYYELAQLYLNEEGDLDQALMDIDKALEMMPERTIFQNIRAEILYKTGRPAEALVIWERLYEQMPGNAGIQRRLEEAREALVQE